jgi:hypothetical protein
VNHKMAIGTVTVSSPIKDPSIVYHYLPSCPVKRHSSSFFDLSKTGEVCQ